MKRLLPHVAVRLAVPLTAIAAALAPTGRLRRDCSTWVPARCLAVAEVPGEEHDALVAASAPTNPIQAHPLSRPAFANGHARVASAHDVPTGPAGPPPPPASRWQPQADFS